MNAERLTIRECPVPGCGSLHVAAGACFWHPSVERVLIEVVRVRDLPEPEPPSARGARAVPARHIVSKGEVRKLCGGITRHTLIDWRATQDFPKPFRTLRLSKIELWDAREVRRWLGARRRASL